MIPVQAPIQPIGKLEAGTVPSGFSHAEGNTEGHVIHSEVLCDAVEAAAAASLLLEAMPSAPPAGRDIPIEAPSQHAPRGGDAPAASAAAQAAEGKQEAPKEATAAPEEAKSVPTGTFLKG